MPVHLCTRCRRELERRPCSQCGTRPRMSKRAVCNPCWSAAVMLLRHWEEQGMPLSWTAPRRVTGREPYWRDLA
jgi:hypothetical protein